MSPSPTKIILAADALVYLPLQILPQIEPACGSEAWEQAFRFVRSPSIGGTEAPPLSGDTGCVARILQCAENNEYVIGVCDPFAILEAGAESQIAIVGGLIRRPCFWIAADEQCSRELNPSIFVQHDKNFITGNEMGKLIASRIQSKFPDSKDKMRILDQPFEDVVDAALALSQKNHLSIAACTASALSAGILMSDIPNFKKFTRVDKTDLSVIQSSVLTSAFIVHIDAISANTDRKLFESRLKYLLFHTINQINQLNLYPKEAERQIEAICKEPSRFEGEKCINSLSVDAGLNVTKKTSKKKVRAVDSRVSAHIRSLLFPDPNDSIYAPLCDITDSDWEGAYFGDNRNGRVQKHLSSVFKDKILKLAQNEFFEAAGRRDPAPETTMEAMSLDRSVFAIISMILIASLAWATLKNENFNWAIKPFYAVMCLVFLLRICYPKRFWKFEKLIIETSWFNKIIILIRFFSVFTLAWSYSYIYRFLSYNCEDQCNSFANNNEYKKYILDHPISYVLTTWNGVWSSVNFTKDDIYAIGTIAITALLATTFGSRKFRIEMRVYWQKFVESSFMRIIRYGDSR